MPGFWSIVLGVTCFKFLLLPTYKSTDFEVHRNWLSITHNLPLKEWYFENRSQWTLDYPPFFAWLEYVLSQAAYYFDPAMLEVRSTPYISEATVFFQQLSVIVTDLVFAYAAYRFCSRCVPTTRKEENGDIFSNKKYILAVLLLTNFGLLIVDHIHFQYNGFLLGILLLSITMMYESKNLQGAFWFAVLLNFKQIYLYVAPAYFIYLLRCYCFVATTGSNRSFSFTRFIGLGLLVFGVFAVSLGPFVYMGQVSQLIARLFPFKRGLCHAYWAPNFWALYNLADKAALIAARALNVDVGNVTTASMTGGLVEEVSHTVLPTITPAMSLGCTLLSVLPALIHLFLYPRGANGFLQCLVLCAFGSFLFGWHVHEKAVLIILLPLLLLVIEKKIFARIFLILAACGHISLFPLLFTNFETLIKVLFFLLYTVFAFYTLGFIHSGRKSWSLPVLNVFESAYVLGLGIVVVYTELVHPLSSFRQRLPFLPLMIISGYCALGVIYSWLRFYVATLSYSGKSGKNL